MTVNFKHLGVNDEESGIIGILACFISCVPALIVSYFSDKLKKYFKVLLVCMMFINIILLIIYHYIIYYTFDKYIKVNQFLIEIFFRPH